MELISGLHCIWTHCSAEREERVGDVGDVFLLREVVRLEEVVLLQAVLEEGLVEPVDQLTLEKYIRKG